MKRVKSDSVKSDKVRWGIVSTAQIGRWVFAPALRDSARGALTGVASRDRERAEAFAGDLGIPEVFASYDDLLWSDRVDAVYLPLPNSMHEEWSIRAMEHGKHVFCEKPLATSPAAAQRMVDAAAQHGVVLMEAMVYRYHPQTLRLRRLLDGGVIGDLRHVDMRMGGLQPTGIIRWQPELGGGVLADIGCYLIDVARWAAGAEPVQVTAVWQEQGGVDSRIALLLGSRVPWRPPCSAPSTPYRCAAPTWPAPAAACRSSSQPIPMKRAPTPSLPRAPPSGSPCTTACAPHPGSRPLPRPRMGGAAPLLPNTDAIATLRVMAAAAESARTGATVHLR